MRRFVFAFYEYIFMYSFVLEFYYFHQILISDQNIGPLYELFITQLVRLDLMSIFSLLSIRQV